MSRHPRCHPAQLSPGSINERRSRQPANCVAGYCIAENRRSAVVPTLGCGGVSPPVEIPGGTPGELAGETPVLRYACRAGAIVLLVEFWFDGGLFTLSTASVFWILLELGVAWNVDSGGLIVDRPKAT